MRDPLRHFAPPDPGAEPGTAISRESYTFSCPVCRRNPSVKAERWWEAMEECRRVGIKEVDLSLVRF